MAPCTKFAVEEKYQYLNGLGNYHLSEAVPGANPPVNNSPQKPPYGLRTERISGTSFTAPREQNLQTWMYRVRSSLERSEFIPHGDALDAPRNLTPNSYMWPTFPGSDDEVADWTTAQRLLARNGDPSTKTGVAMWIFAIRNDMPECSAFSSLDGDALIIPQAGTLNIQTELGRLLLRQNEIAVIPRGIRYRVTLPDGPARGYICELFQGHFRLPDLGAIGSTGLANVRDFQIPTAYFQGKLTPVKTIEAESGRVWTIVSRLSSRLWKCTQDHTPFDVVAWHGTNYPYKYDLGRFVVLGNMLFDEHDPSLYVVLTAPSHRDPGHSVVDFAVVPPRWQVAESTLWLPYYHRNTCPEFFAPIIAAQGPNHPLNTVTKDANDFFPFAAGLNGSHTTHGASEPEFQKASNAKLKPTKIQDEGVTIFLLETEKPLFVADWAEESAMKNSGGGGDGGGKNKAKI